MKKKAISLVLALTMCLGLMAVPASAALKSGEEWVGDFVVNTQTKTLVKYYGEDSAVTVPSGVTTIGTYAFSGCTSLKSVTIPSGVTKIEHDAFSGCTDLTSLTIPSGVTEIGDYTFNGCTSLTSVTIPSSVTKIGHNAFYGCASLTSATIPSSVTEIGNGTFYGCASLTSVTIPSSVTKIGSGMFSNCSSLTSVTIPSSVTEIGPSAFQFCTSLTNITIPSGITTIDGHAFWNCTSLTSVTIPDGVTYIKDNAFWDCTSLTSVTIPFSVTHIGAYSFLNCPLTDIYYGGTKAQWNAIRDDGSDIKDNVTIHYESASPSGTTTTQPQQPAAETSASPTNDKLEVNGAAADPTVYKIGDSNYFKIRDVAALLNGTEKQFAVGYDAALSSVTAATGQGYEKQSGDLAGAAAGGNQTAAVSNDTIYVDGQKVEAEVYKINGSNYFKLRDLGKALNFYVGWTAQRGMYIETDKPYSE